VLAAAAQPAPAVQPPPAPYQPPAMITTNATTAVVTDLSPATPPGAPVRDDAIAKEDAGSGGPPRVSLALNVDQIWHTQKSYDLFSDNDIQASLGGSIGYAVWIQGPWSVVPELGFGIDQSSGGMRYGGVIESSELDSFRGYAGGRVRYLLLPFLEPHVRLVGGLESLQASIRSSTGESFENSATPFFGTIGAGFSVHTLPGQLTQQRGGIGTLVLGFVFEGGYTFAGSMDLALAPAGPVARAQTETTGFGTLERSGPYLRFAADVRF